MNINPMDEFVERDKFAIPNNYACDKHCNKECAKLVVWTQTSHISVIIN